MVRKHGIQIIEEVDLVIFEKKDSNISVLVKSFQPQSVKKKKIHRIVKDSVV